MHIMWFTERAYHHVPEDEVLKLRSFFGVPNKFFDPQKGAQLLNQYLDEKIYSDELGTFDGVMLNEHHGTPFCMGAVMDVEAAVLAKCTSKVKIVLLGNPLPVVANPVRLAEELAMIDLISGGRLVPGWVRGAGSEQLANNANPAYNREYFEEAHDLVIAAWTRPGPFRWEGKHFNFRFVNPWVLPLQKPHPPIWIPGLISPETVRWCAEHRYPYVALATMLKPTLEMWKMYTDRAAEMGYQAGPENFGYLQPIFVLRPTRRRTRWAATSSTAAASRTSRGPNGCSRRATTPGPRPGGSRPCSPIPTRPDYRSCPRTTPKTSTRYARRFTRPTTDRKKLCK